MNKSSPSGQLAYSGMRVLDVTRVLASPYATYLLALQGADVIKIEDPLMQGDTLRRRGGGTKELYAEGMGTSYLSQNANKRSLTLNLRTPEGQEIFRELARDADVIVENLRSGKMAEYKLSYEDLRDTNERLVYCSLTGFGQNGPNAKYPAYDSVIQAASGIMSLTGTPQTAPLKAGVSLVDYGAGMIAAFAIASALVHRERSGEGQYIDVSMLDTALALMGSTVTDSLTIGTVPKPHGNTSGPNYIANQTFRVGDEQIYICASEPHQQQHLWQVLGLEHIPADPRFASLERVKENRSALQKEIELALQARSIDEWEKLLNQAGVPAQRVRTLPEILQDPVVTQRGFLHRFDAFPGVPQGTTVTTLPFKMSATPGRAITPPAQLGQDTVAIMLELGYSSDAIAVLLGKEII